MLIAAEFIDAPPGWTPGRAGGGTTGHRRRSGYEYTSAQVRAAMREIAARLGRSPKTTEWPAERDRLLDEEAEKGLLPRPFPSLGLIQNRYATWDEALLDASLEPTNGKHNKQDCGDRRTGRRVRDQDIIDAMREAYLKLGPPFTSTAYQRWRTEQIAEDTKQRRYRRIPRYCAIWARYGNWANACTVAFAGWPPAEGLRREAA